MLKKACWLIKSETPITMRVVIGSATPDSLKVEVREGRTKMDMATPIIIMAKTMTEGYIIAPRTLLFKSASRCNWVDRYCRLNSKLPDISPTLIMLKKMLEKTVGCFSR